jgi:hypothetical protein
MSMERSMKFSTAILIGISLLLCSTPVFAQFTEDLGYEEIIVKFEVPRLINQDISAIYDGRDIFLPLAETFGLLDIDFKSDPGEGKFSGQYMTASNKFEIDLPGSKAKCFGKIVTLEAGDYILTQTDLFLKIDLYQAIFNLKMHFNFSQLNVYLPLDRKFPAYQKLKRKAAHDKLLAEEASARDIQEIPSEKENLKVGVADWVLTLNPLEKKGQYLGLGLGGMILGGDISVNGSANSGSGFRQDEIRYKWRYAFLDNNYITQIELGEINTVGPLMRRLKGALLTNKPAVQRKYFETITVSGHAGDGWEVELYINNRLIDFAYTDQNGDYEFLVDIQYGSSRILLKMYGPNGEMRTEEKFIRAPFNLIPKNDFEYTVAAGERSSYRDRTRYAQASGYYGLLGGLTLGLNSDYPIDAEDDEKPSMAAEATLHPFGNLLLGASYSPNYAAEFDFNYSRPSLVNLSARYKKFYENQFWNKMNQVENFSLAVSSPLKIGRRYLSLRYRLTIDRYPLYKITNMNYGFKLPVFRLHLNYIGSYKISEYMTRRDRRTSSQLFASTSFVRWPRPQFRINYDHDIGRISKVGVYLQKRVFRVGQLAFSFERNTLTNSDMFMISFNIFTDFANLTSRATITKQQTIVTQTQKGSIRYNQNTGSIRFDRRNGLGLGTAVIWPFLDANYNGTYDDGERLLPELRADVGGARGIKGGKERLYYYDGLRPYDKYIVKIDPYSLDDPLLRPAHDNFMVSVNPNIVTGINVPVVTASEMGGVVQRRLHGEKIGVGGIKIRIVNEINGKEVVISTFNDGEYFYLGLVPGMYKAFPDPKQLADYTYESEPPSISFQVKTVEGGDYIENISFLIKPKE